SAFRASPVAMVISALADGRIVDANDRFLAMFGRERADVLGQPSQDLGMWVDPADRARALGARVRDRAVRDLEVAVRAAGGQSRQVLLSAEPLNLAGAQCILTALYDITERVQAEAALARQAATLREQAHLLDLAFDAILVHDLDTQTVTFWNAGAAAMYGWTEDEVMGQNAHTLLQTHFPLPLPEIRAVLEREGQWRGELVHRAKGGEELIVDSRWVVRHDEADRPRSVLEINRDITERKRLEAQLLQSQKMESVGQLAGGIAHDFNNLLTAISGYAELIADALPASVDLHAEVQEIQKAAARATLLTRQLLTFARRQPMAARVIDLNEQIRDLGGLLRRLIGEHIALVAVAAPDLAPVWGDPGQIEQVIVNLALNARDAMPDGGTLTIETDNVDLDPRYARGHLDVPAGQYVMLAVNDTGMGMPPEVQSHIFEPFFTTKPPGEGTGLGLSTCYGIVKQHGGTIWIYSEVGVGTVVKIYLQRYEGGGAAAPAKSAGSAALPRGTETVLLVEDEEAVRALAARVLRSCGYRVLEAPDGAAALRVAEIHAPEVIHLLLTDVVMPQLGGPAVAAQIVTWYPHIRVLFMSGYPGHATIQHGYVDASANMIQKPFTPTTLAQAVRAVLERA
ncbi:MAG TPA: PAS domain S-box protein, partial [Roseiflexaceae bacterium]